MHASSPLVLALLVLVTVALSCSAVGAVVMLVLHRRHPLNVITVPDGSGARRVVR